MPDFELPEDTPTPSVPSDLDIRAETTRIQALNQSLLQEREDLRRSLSVLAHDLRNHLSTSKVCAQLLLRHPDSGRETVAKYAARIVSAIDRADGLIDPLESGEKPIGN
jgi:nitrogen-specific signal transduction histidine kinase